MMEEKIKFVYQEIERLLSMAKQGKILREGISTAIIGRPNVGKSSLLNSLVQENKAIVTDIPGTTRDVLEEYVNIRGVPLRLVDTAGIRETEDIVEKIGVERSHQVLKEADLVLLVLNSAEELTKEDEALFQAIEGLEAIIVLNKIDLDQKIEEKRIQELAQGRPIIRASLLKDEGIDEVEEAISRIFFEQGVETT